MKVDALSGVNSDNTYSSTVYDKGALIAMSLKTYIGDSLFYSSVQRLLEDFAFSNIDSYTLRDSLSSYSGIDLTDFFNYYVFDTLTHHFTINKELFFCRKFCKNKNNISHRNRQQLSLYKHQNTYYIYGFSL